MRRVRRVGGFGNAGGRKVKEVVGDAISFEILTRGNVECWDWFDGDFLGVLGRIWLVVGDSY